MSLEDGAPGDANVVAASAPGQAEQLAAKRPGYWSRLVDRPHVRKILGNSGWLLADRIGRLAVGLVVGLLVARYLGPERLGRLSYASALVAIVGAIGTFGTESILTRDLVRHQDRASILLGSGFSLRIVGGLIVVLGSILVALVTRPESPEILAMVALLATTSVFAAADVIDQWFQSRVEAKYSVLGKSIAFLGASGLRVGLVFSGASLLLFAWAQWLEALLGALALVVMYHVTGGRAHRWRLEWSTARQLMRDGWPLLLSGVMIMIYMRIDQVMLGAMSGDEEVGIYSVAVRLAELWYFIPWVLISSTLPSIIQGAEHSEAMLLGRMQRLYNSVSIISYAIAIPVSLLATPVVRLLYGEAYIGAAPVLMILVWTIHFTSLGMARSSFLVAKNWNRLHLATVALGAIVNVILNLWLIPRWGAIGAAVATVIAYWLAAHGSCFVYPRLHQTGAMLTRALFIPRL